MGTPLGCMPHISIFPSRRDRPSTWLDIRVGSGRGMCLCRVPSPCARPRPCPDPYPWPAPATRCNCCDGPYDSFGAQCRCTYCRVLVLVCGNCQVVPDSFANVVSCPDSLIGSSHCPGFRAAACPCLAPTFLLKGTSMIGLYPNQPLGDAVFRRCHATCGPYCPQEGLAYRPWRGLGFCLQQLVSRLSADLPIFDCCLVGCSASLDVACSVCTPVLVCSKLACSK